MIAYNKKGCLIISILVVLLFFTIVVTTKFVPNNLFFNETANKEFHTTPIKSLIHARQNPIIVVSRLQEGKWHPNKVLVIGNVINNNLSKYSQHAELLDLKDNNIKLTSPYTLKNYHNVLFNYGIDKIVNVKVFKENDNDNYGIELYDILNDKWTLIKTKPIPRKYFDKNLPNINLVDIKNDYIFIWGGVNYYTGLEEQTLEVIDFKNDKLIFKQKCNLKTGEIYSENSNISFNGKKYIFIGNIDGDKILTNFINKKELLFFNFKCDSTPFIFTEYLFLNDSSSDSIDTIVAIDPKTKKIKIFLQDQEVNLNFPSRYETYNFINLFPYTGSGDILLLKNNKDNYIFYKYRQRFKNKQIKINLVPVANLKSDKNLANMKHVRISKFDDYNWVYTDGYNLYKVGEK